MRPSGAATRRGRRVAREAFGPARHPAEGGTAAARRQRRLPAGRLRLSAHPSGAGHPLPDRGRHPHRHRRPFDLVRPGQRLVRERARSGVRAGGGRSAEPLHPRDDPAAGADREKLAATGQRGRQEQAAIAAVQDLRRCADCVRGEGVSERDRRRRDRRPSHAAKKAAKKAVKKKAPPKRGSTVDARCRGLTAAADSASGCWPEAAPGRPGDARSVRWCPAVDCWRSGFHR